MKTSYGSSLLLMDRPLGRSDSDTCIHSLSLFFPPYFVNGVIWRLLCIHTNKDQAVVYFLCNYTLQLDVAQLQGIKDALKRKISNDWLK